MIKKKNNKFWFKEVYISCRVDRNAYIYNHSNIRAREKKLIDFNGMSTHVGLFYV